MKKLFIIPVCLALILSSCYTSTLVQSAKIINPGQLAANLSLESNTETMGQALPILPSYGIRAGIAKSVELQTRTNLFNHFELGTKVGLSVPNCPIQTAVGFSYAYIIPPEVTLGDGRNSGQREHFFNIPVYVSHEFDYFTVFGGGKLGMAAVSKEVGLQTNLGLAFPVFGKNKFFFMEGYYAQVPSSVKFNNQQKNRVGISLGISFNAF